MMGILQTVSVSDAEGVARMVAEMHDAAHYLILAASGLEKMGDEAVMLQQPEKKTTWD